MTRINLSLDPVDLITVDAIGKPGNRIFYIQGRQGEQVVSLIIEKIQLQSLIAGVSEFLKEVVSKFPDRISTDVDLKEDAMRILAPVDPKFRVGDMGLAYDDERDLVCIIAREMDIFQNEENEDGDAVEPEELKKEEEGNAVRYWCTRGQLLTMAHWGAIVLERGRPICPQCLQPMEPEGHFCPKKNGHKKPVQE
jgi:uncharacterized repeat protein (TIGR03847 family)